MYEENVQDFNLTSVAKPVNTHKHTHSQHFKGNLVNSKTPKLNLAFFLFIYFFVIGRELDLNLITFNNNKLNAKSIDI